MKRIMEVLIIYTAIIFGACIGISFLYGHLPVLLDNVIKSYQFTRGLSWFLTILPAILLSGFMIGCAIQWKTNTEDSRQKFSTGMVNRFKKVIGIGIVITAVLTYSAEVFVPDVEKKLSVAESNPALLKKYMSLCRTSLALNHPMVAWQFAEQAYLIYPQNNDVAALYKQAKDAKDIAVAAATSNPASVQKVLNPIQDEQRGYTIRQMIEKSQKAAAEKRWFDSHYWATLAVTACDGTNTNLAAAQDAANTAWNKLNNPVPFDSSEESAFFARKKEGYSALNRGDDLQAYYIFNELSDSSKEHASDPDVKQYLAIAKERVLGQYFFIDETDDLKKIETRRDVYFSLPYADGSKDVIYVRGVATLKQAGGMVRYLDGLTVVSFDRYGVYQKTMSVPFAKMMEESTEFLDEEQLNVMGISKKVKSIPYVQLQSVDRTTQGIVSKPEYTFTPNTLTETVALQFADQKKYEALIASKKTGKKQTAAVGTVDVLPGVAQPTTWLIPMPYADFSLLNDASFGAARMSFLSLINFVPKSVLYGYAQEVFAQNLVRRGAYPLILLIMIVFIASFAWNYRVGEHDVFQFKWLFLFPLFSFVVYVLLDCCQYLFTLLNYVFVGLCGSYALITAFVVYVVMLFSVSVNFLARRSS